MNGICEIHIVIFTWRANMFKIYFQCQRWRLRRLKIFIRSKIAILLVQEKSSSNSSHDFCETRGFVPFLRGINLRRVEAKRSVLGPSTVCTIM
nr:unnamed protein product [Callosobruchus analis]